MARKSSKGGGGSAFMGFLLGAVTVAGAGYAWMHYGGSAAKFRADLPSLPSGVATDSGKSGDPSMTKPLPPVAHARPTPPFGTSEDVFEGGAHVYRANCASCHGTPGHEGSVGRSMTPPATQIWKNKAALIHQEPGDIYTKIAHGVHGSGMPAFAGKLSNTQIWQVALLLKNSDGDLPDPVMNILEGK